MSVVVEYFFPVSVFCAVMVTPGSGMLPLFTTPWSLPPATVGLCVSAACGEAAAVLKLRRARNLGLRPVREPQPRQPQESQPLLPAPAPLAASMLPDISCPYSV